MNAKNEVVRGSGNIYRDLGMPDADVRQTKALMASEIVKILDKEKLSVRKAGELTKYDYADFSRIRNADLSRFTIDKLMMILNRFNRRVSVKISVRPENNKEGAKWNLNGMIERK